MLAGLDGSGDIAWLVVAAVLAGLVRGFAGFGTAMVFMPVAARLTDPVLAALMLQAMDLLGPLPAVPRALREAHLSELAWLVLGVVIGLPLGIYFLTTAPVDTFRVAVSVATLILLALLVSGVRYRGRLSPPMIAGTGALSGVLGGATTLFGPPAILIYMASTLPAHVIRANMMLFLLFTDAVFLAMLGLSGEVVLAPMLTGLALVLPYGAATLLGQFLFRPEAERLYRIVAYTIIAAAAISGLPTFG